MSSARQLNFQPRSNLRRTLAYRPVIKIPYYGSLALQLIYSAYFAWELAFLLQKGYSFSEAFRWTPWLGLAIWTGLTVWILRPLVKTLIHVDSTGITLQRGDQKIEIPYANMSRIILPNEIYSKALIPGFFAVKMASGEQFYFTVAIERSEYLLETITSRRPEIVNIEKLAQLRLQALVMDHGWARQRDHFVKAPLKLILKYVGFPLLQTVLALSLLPHSSEVDPLFLSTWLYMTAAALGLGLPIYSLKAAWMASQEKKKLLAQPQAVIRDLQYEKKMDRNFDLVYWILMLSYFGFFLISRIL